VPESAGHRRYAFGSFVADTVTRRLWREGRPVPITAKTFDVLSVLLEHRDRLVTKDELLDRVWPDTAVQENNLARQVSSLRRALGQRPDEADYVLTVPGQGYRFVANALEIPELPGGLRDANGLHHPRPSESLSDVDDLAGDDRATDDRVRAAAAPVVEHSKGLGPGSSVAPRPRWRLTAVLGGAVLLLALGVGTTLVRRGDGGPQARRMLQRITFDDVSLPREASWSPDGQWIVFASDRDGRTDLWKQRVGDPDPVRVTTSAASESQPEWSPDGRSIVFRSERDGGGLYTIPADGGAERLVSSFGYEPRWSPDSTQILFKRSVILPDLPTIYVVRLDGRPPRPLRPGLLGQFRSLQAAWYPDGRRVSIWGTDQRGEPRFLNVPLDAGEVTSSRISAGVQRNLAGVTPLRFVWAPSRRYLYFEGRANDTNNIWRITADPSTGQLTDGPVRLTTGTGQETNLAVSPDGTTMLFTSATSRTRVWAFPLDSSGRIIGEPHPITQGSTGEIDFDAQADGSKVAYRAVRAGRNELWERSLGGHERLLLSSPDWKLARPRWSPNGAKLAFLRCGTEGGTPVLAVLNADGSGERALTQPDQIEMLASDWSNTGESILGSCRFSRSDRYATCVLPVSSASTSSSVRVIASDPKRNLFNQRFSPDQRWIVFLAHDLLYNATSTVYVMPSTGGGWRAMTDGASFDDKPRWGPDGRVLYYVSNRDGVSNVWGRRFDSENGTPIGEPFPLTSFRSPQFLISSQTVQMDIAITSTHLLIPMSESRGDIWMLDHIDD
jgi:Tol biopolymer transport system component/DNA-binding winged helix-turn-helix (wHTH) protein